jgi:hypothetical protein
MTRDATRLPRQAPDASTPLAGPQVIAVREPQHRHSTNTYQLYILHPSSNMKDHES